MDLITATKYAAQLLTWLAPFCDRIEIAGSVRRQRPICNDIDLVVIPKFGPAPTDLFGKMTNLPPNLLHAALTNYVRDYLPPDQSRAREQAVPQIVPRWQAGEHNPDGSNFILQLPKCQLDIYVATAENWGSKLLQRTGSKEHNVWLATRAKQLGYHWELDAGIVGVHPDHSLAVGVTEEALYRVLNLNFIPPSDREPGRLDRFIPTSASPLRPPVQNS